MAIAQWRTWDWASKEKDENKCRVWRSLAFVAPQERSLSLSIYLSIYIYIHIYYHLPISPGKIMRSTTISNQGFSVPWNDWGLCVATGGIFPASNCSSVQPVPAAMGTVHATCHQNRWTVCEPTQAPRFVWFSMESLVTKWCPQLLFDRIQ